MTEIIPEYSGPYQPLRDPETWNVNESEEDYITRMTPILHDWPEELLREWLYRHAGDQDEYEFLDFQTLRFQREEWPIHKIPGKEAFQDESFCESFSKTFEERVAIEPEDWLARYMKANGTWSTPIVLLDNRHGEISAPPGKVLRQPYHLLEGHRRLSFLVALREAGEAKPTHAIWLATKRGFPGSRKK